MDITKSGEPELLIPPEVLSIMDQRSIFMDDVKKVVAHSLISGERFFNPEDPSYLAGLRIKNITCWVRYAEREDGIHILSVYSHRLEVMEE